MSCKKGRLPRTVGILCIAALLCGSFCGCRGNAASGAAASNSPSAAPEAASSESEKVSFSIVVPYQDEQAQEGNIVEKPLKRKRIRKSASNGPP